MDYSRLLDTVRSVPWLSETVRDFRGVPRLSGTVRDSSGHSEVIWGCPELSEAAVGLLLKRYKKCNMKYS